MSGANNVIEMAVEIAESKATMSEEKRASLGVLGSQTPETLRVLPVPVVEQLVQSFFDGVLRGLEEEIRSGTTTLDDSPTLYRYLKYTQGAKRWMHSTSYAELDREAHEMTCEAMRAGQLAVRGGPLDVKEYVFNE